MKLQKQRAGALNISWFQLHILWGNNVPQTCTVLTLAPALPLTCWITCVQLPVTGSQVRSTPLELPVTIAMPSGVREMQSTLSAGPCECGEGYKTLW